MTPAPYTEDSLVQKTTAEYLERELGWESVYAFNNEVFLSNPHPQSFSQGEKGVATTAGSPLPLGEGLGEGAQLAGGKVCLGRESDREVVLIRYLRAKIEELNPGLPATAYEDAVRQIVTVSAAQTLLATNREKYELIKEGVQVIFRNDKGDRAQQRLRVFDFDHPQNNHFLCVRELWVRGDLYRRRADIVGFVNGLPLFFMELKNVNRAIRVAYEENLKDYRDTIPHLFDFNAFIVLANGVDAKIGSVTSGFDHFHEWKRLTEDQKGAVDMETLLKGICDKRNFMDLFENFILFDESRGNTRKILARNHQFLGVNRAIEAVGDRQERQGRLGVFWHTQGAGKSYSMVFFTRKVHRKIGANFTFLILTDRDDLDTQIYKTFAGCGVVDNDKDPCRATCGEHLSLLLAQQKTHIFSLIHKFNLTVSPGDAYTQRNDIIVITDEAHRTQYGTLALNMRNALPNAGYMGFTGTPLFKDDEITRRVFGDYISTYDFQRAVEDNATVPLYYDVRGDKLGLSIKNLNEQIAEKLENLETGDINIEQRLEREIKRDYHIITSEPRLKQIALDFVRHYSNAWESGKAMLVCIDKPTCVRMYKLIEQYWKEQIEERNAEIASLTDSASSFSLKRLIEWMRETRMAVVISEEQGEVERFRSQGLDVIPHRRLIKEGMDLPDAMRRQPRFQNMQRLSLDDAFKAEEHPFRIAIVCAMWLTGFDVPCLSTLYLDKPLKAHTLMQAIARANRVNEGKNNGLIVDYCGILKNLRKALATFAGTPDGGRGDEGGTVEPARPNGELLAELAEAIGLVRMFLAECNASLDDIIQQSGFSRNAAILTAKEAVNENDETRKRFEVMCRAVFTYFKACINIQEVNQYRSDHDALSIIYRSLRKDCENADINSIIRQMQQIVNEAIRTKPQQSLEETKPFDISKIDFDRLRQEFERIPLKRTTVQNLKYAIEKRVLRLIQQNPLRTNFQRHYEEIVEEYNREKDRVTVEQTFEALLKFIREMDDEENRAVRENLNEESLTIFDMLMKPELTPAEIKRIKAIAVSLLDRLKSEKLRIDNWREKESTRDAVRQSIRDFLWNDTTGLPVAQYTENEVYAIADEVYHHVYRVYPTLPSPYYQSTGAA